MMNCRHCGIPLTHNLIDLGFAPPSNAYLTVDNLSNPEVYFPLRVKVCDNCWLVQTEDYQKSHELFLPNYAYFSSTSETWLEHAEKFANQAISKLGISTNSFVVEIASNDGYLLKNFVAAGVPCLGIEPTRSTAAVAEQLGIPQLREFFDEEVAERLSTSGRKADLIIGNNVFAHVPSINSFTHGLKILLNQGGTITLEFPHLLQLVSKAQFDTIYHEHYSYLSVNFVCKIFNAFGLRIFDVEEIPTHGGSVRVYGCHGDDPRVTQRSVNTLVAREQRFGLQSLSTYTNFQERSEIIKNNFMAFLLETKKNNKTVFGYGAAAKGNTLLNYAGVKPDLLPKVFDAAQSKQGKFMPGSHIPIVAPELLFKNPPDYLLVLPWNLATEVMAQYGQLAHKGTKFVTAVPEVHVL